METEEQIEQYRNSTAKAFASLPLGLWSVSLIGYLTSGVSWSTYFLVIAGILSTLFVIYLRLPWDWKRKQLLDYLSEDKAITEIVESLGWFIVLAVFATGLIQTKVIWLILTGIIVGGIAYLNFLISIIKRGKDKKKEKHA